MPNFVFQGPSPGAYPMGRDAYGYPVGTVKPGDVLELTEALDADWMPYESVLDDLAHHVAILGGIEVKPPPAGVRVTPGETSSEQGNDDTAGVTGSEES